MTQESTRVEERPSTLDAHGLLTWARRCVEQLAARREEINALNVFPVPDADTGTNLLYTMRAAVDRAEGEDAWISEGGGTAGAREIAVALGHGAVHGARGNSGVILSQVLRAVGEAATFTVVDASTYRRALRTAVTLVDHALSEPVEGNIVTVLREAATAAGRSSASSLVEVARVAADAGAEALDRTTSQLPALSRAGVVDAGGRGLLVLLDAMVEILAGQTPERPDYFIPKDGAEASSTPGHDTDEPHEDAGTRYEVMYSLTHSDDARADELLVLPNGELSRDQIGAIDAALRDGEGHALILPTGSVVQGLAALAVHDPTTTLSLDGFSMADAAAGTRHAHLTRAEQDALTLVGRCTAGDLLGVVGHDVALIESDAVDAVCALVDRVLSSGGELVTVLFGDAYDEAATESALSRVRSSHPDIEVVGYAAGPGRAVAQVGVE